MLLGIQVCILLYFAVIFVTEWDKDNFELATLALAVGTWMGILMDPAGAASTLVASLQILSARLGVKLEPEGV